MTTTKTKTDPEPAPEAETIAEAPDTQDSLSNADPAPEPEPEPSPRYRVRAQYCQVKVAATMLPSAKSNGITVLGFYKHQLLPADAVPADVARLLEKGAIEEVVING